MPTVDLLTFDFWTCLSHIMKALFCYNIIHSFVKDKYHPAITIISILIPYIVIAYFTTLYATPLNDVFFMLLMWVFLIIDIKFSTIGSTFQKVLSFVFAQITLWIATLSFYPIEKYVYGVGMEYATKSKFKFDKYIFMLVFIYLLSFLFVFIIKLIKNRQNNIKLNYKNKYMYFFIFPFSHIFSMIIIIAIFMESFTSYDSNIYSNSIKTLDSIFYVFILMCIILDFSIIFVIDHFEKAEADSINNHKKLMQNEIDYQQILLTKHEKSSLRKIKHDITNIVTTAKGFIEIGKPEKALSILNKTNADMLNIVGVSLCSNDTINTVANMKIAQAKEENITLNITINDSANLKIDDYDLCRILCNIIDNSLNAVKLTDNKTSFINISYDEDSLTIESKNEFNEKEKPKESANGEHGNGVKIIKEIAKKYNGEYATNTDNNIYLTKTVLQNN